MFQPNSSATSNLPYSNGHLSPPSPKRTPNLTVTPESESDLSEALDLPNAPTPLPNGARHRTREEGIALEAGEESEEDAFGEDDPDYDMEAPAPANHTPSRGIPSSSSEESPRQRKRKAAVEPDDFILNDPELYGLRRSVSYESFIDCCDTNPIIIGSSSSFTTSRRCRILHYLLVNILT